MLNYCAIESYFTQRRGDGQENADSEECWSLNGKACKHAKAYTLECAYLLRAQECLSQLYR